MKLCEAWKGDNRVRQVRHPNDGIEDMTYGRLVTTTYDSTTGREEVQACVPYCGAVSWIHFPSFTFLLTSCVPFWMGGLPFSSFPQGLTLRRDWCDSLASSIQALVRSVEGDIL